MNSEVADFLSASGQRWKVQLFLATMAVAALVLVLVGVFYSPDRPWVLVYGLPVALGAGALALLWIALAVRCPRCRTSVGWKALTRADAARIVSALSHIESCPRCGWPGPPT